MESKNNINQYRSYKASWEGVWEFMGILIVIVMSTFAIWDFLHKNSNKNVSLGHTEVTFHPPLNSYKSFGGLDLLPLKLLDESEVEKLILKSTPSTLRKRLKKYLRMALQAADKYEVDPFWVLAIMWTESHFHPHARSSKNAKGLMQIKQGTGNFLASLMKKQKLSHVNAELLFTSPRVNIEIGTFYLSRLLKRFNGSHRLATVAYNMGPTRVRRRLNRKLEVGVNNLYLNKVRRAYSRLSRHYRRLVESDLVITEGSYVMRRSVNMESFL